MADRDNLTPILLLGGLGVAVYFLYQNGTLAQWFPSVFGTAAPSTGGTTTTQPTAAAPAAPAGSGVTTQQTGTGAPPGATGAPGLTAADAATFPYSGAVTAAQMTSISQTLTPQLDAGQIPLIGGNSVLAYMLGWGNQPSGAIEQIPGTNYSYQFTGSSWILVQPSASSTAQTSTASSKQVLSYALNLWANANNYSSQMNMSQWNYILNVVVPGGAPPVMTDPYQGGVMTAAQYVQALLADPTYTNNVAAIAANFGMSGFGKGNFYGRHARVPVSMIHARSGLKVYRGGR